MNVSHRKQGIMKWYLVFFTLVLGAFVVSSAGAFTVNVVGVDNDVNTPDAPVAGFKWVLEQDNTHLPQPGVHLPADPGDVNNNTLSVSIHQSHAHVLASGEETTATATIDTTQWDALTGGRYFVSVLPFGDRSSCDGTYDMGGAPVDISNPGAVTAFVRQHPVETAQITVKVFHDIAPLNNAPDVPEIFVDPLTGVPDLPMPDFTVTLAEQGGDIVQDAFGNILGTTYEDVPLNADCEPTVKDFGTGDFVTPANGEVIIKNLRPGKYAVQVEPPAGGPTWYQTTTIEGSKTIDAWVRPNEPPFLIEFGGPLWHVFTGFVQGQNNLPAGGTGTITGTVNKGHLARPPSVAIFNGPPFETENVGERCIVGLNRLEAGFPEAVWVGLCEDETGNFTINNVPPGTYQIITWDLFLLGIIDFGTVRVPDTGGLVDVGDIAVRAWFGQQNHNVYFDANKNAIRDPGEEGILEQGINLRFRDGTIVQSFPTDLTGFVPFQEVFPRFHWEVAEVDFARFQVTGLEVVIDDGGPVSFNQFGEGLRNPQFQGPGGTSGPQRRIERGTDVLLGAYQQFQGSNTKFNWGKANYDVGDINVHPFQDFPGPGDTDVCDPAANHPRSVPATCPGPGLGDGEYNNNGGISGIVYYATTRAEDDPRFAAGEEWEPGIPHVQVALYRDDICNANGLPAFFPLCLETPPGEFGDGIPDDRVRENGTVVTPGTVTYSDVDNWPLNWRPVNCITGGQTCSPGPEDVDRNGNGNFNVGDAIRVITADSWDDDQPSNCKGNSVPVEIHGTSVPLEQCAKGLRTYNQVRPALFDGGYAFPPGDLRVTPGTYIVEAATPPGMKVAKEEDRNVDFANIPIPTLLPSRCVGDDHVVPPLFSFLTDENGVALPGVTPGGDNEAPFAGETRKLCDRKSVVVKAGQNAATDFFLFTDVPKAARGVGNINDDFATELGPNRPAFTEKFSPAWISIALFDYTGKQLFRSYGDEFGAFNFMAPSHYNVNPPSPSGIEPKMHQFCLNHPGPIEDPANPGTFITDPFFKAQYSTTCYQFNFEAGRTTYLDTPVIRQAAFVGPLQQTLDCAEPNQTPVIRSVLNNAAGEGEPTLLRDEGFSRIVIRSMGVEQVPNPAFPGDNNPPFGIPDDPPTEPQFITRNHGFGPDPGAGNRGGRVCVTTPDLGSGEQTTCFADGHIIAWNNNRIIVRRNNANPLPAGMATGQLTVARSNNGNTTLVGVTLTITDDFEDGIGGAIVRVGPTQTYTTIQAGIDAADPGDLVLVDPGSYFELPILYKRIKLQGAGAGSTEIVASHFSSGPNFPNPLVAWRDKIAALEASGDLGLLPEQQLLFDTNPDLFLVDEEGPGIFVAPVQTGLNRFGFAGDRDDLARRARIDGFTIRLADLGGAIWANAYANRLLISNNVLRSNAGRRGGGIRIGNQGNVLMGGPAPDSMNPGIDIRHNDVNQNGSLGTGGGASLFKGALNYRIRDSKFCGNLARSGGGGIAHRGLSDNGTIAGNDIIFNEVFQGDQPAAGLGIGGGGGGIEIAGAGQQVGGLSEGAGDVLINQNLIQGNLTGASDGGGIALRNVNGDDVAASSDPADWWKVRVFNNLIVNNISGFGGAGIGLQDTTRAKIVHNTIAHNDATATSVFAFEGGVTLPTTPQPAGIVSRPHSAGMIAALPPGSAAFSDPVSLRRNILSMNRTFFYDNNAPPPQLQPNPDGADWDLGVLGTGSADCLSPTQAVLTDLVPTADPAGCDYTGSNNVAIDPVGFVDDYFNTLVTAATADEGGSFVQVYFTPIAPTGDYHLCDGPPGPPFCGPASLAIDLPPNGSGTGFLLGFDIDGDVRPQGAGPDTGADEVFP